MPSKITIFFSLLLLVSCVSTNVVDEPNSNKSKAQEDNNRKTNNVVNKSNNTNTNTNTTNSNTATNLSENKTENESNNVSSTQNNSVMPPSISEEDLYKNYNMSQLLKADGDDSDWKKFREAYITQYLKNLAYIPYAIEKDTPKEVIEYLNKGYGMYWSPVVGVHKELEYGLLSARSQKISNLESHLNNLSANGKGRDYYILAYITSLLHVKNNNVDKASALISECELIAHIENFAIDIPDSDVQKLQSKVGN